MMTLKSALLGMVAVGAAGAFVVGDRSRTPATLEAAPAPAAGAEAARTPEAVLDPDTVRFRVEGMTCGGCAVATRIVLGRLDGVEEAEVSYEESEAIVVYDPEKVTADAMVAAIRELGYTATVVKDDGEHVGRR